MASAKSMGLRNAPMKIIITGSSSSGIGKFLADTLTANGHEVCRLARSPQGGFWFSMRYFGLEGLANLRRKNFRELEKCRCADLLRRNPRTHRRGYGG